MMESKQFYVYISSADSTDYFPDNEPSKFTVKLPETLRLRGKWQLALCEIQYPSIQKKKKKPEQLLILCDLCQDSIVGEKRLPVLRRMRYEEPGNTSFGIFYYVSLKTQEADRITVYIKTEKGEEPSFESGKLLCTLHFQHV